MLLSGSWAPLTMREQQSIVDRLGCEVWPRLGYKMGNFLQLPGNSLFSMMFWSLLSFSRTFPWLESRSGVASFACTNSLETYDKHTQNQKHRGTHSLRDGKCQLFRMTSRHVTRINQSAPQDFTFALSVQGQPNWRWKSGWLYSFRDTQSSTTSSSHYFDTNRRNNAWRYISSELGITSEHADTLMLIGTSGFGCPVTAGVTVEQPPKHLDSGMAVIWTAPYRAAGFHRLPPPVNQTNSAASCSQAERERVVCSVLLLVWIWSFSS